MSSFRDGTVNLAGIVNPGVLVDQILPTPFITGVPTNIEGLVGVGSWGPLNSAQYFSTLDDCAGIYGVPQIRTSDLPFYVQTARKEGGSVGFCGIRVSDGSDTAATATLANSLGTITARYSGIRGNQIGVTFQRSTAVGAYAAIISFPGRTPERFDNITAGLGSITVTPGTGYSSVPSAVVSLPQRAGGIPATVQPTLTSLPSPTVTGAGAGYVVGDNILLPNGMVLTVATVTGGAVTTVTVTTPATIRSGSAPANPVAQTSTTLANGSPGAGTGATFTILYGLGTPVFTSGSGYYSASGAAGTVTLSGGGGTGGTYTVNFSFAGALAQAINTGTLQQGRSRYIVFTPGTGTGTPTLNTPVLLTGGTDGASGVGSAQLIGVDTTPRTGMYALRRSRVDGFTLCDLTDPTTWATQLSFATSEECMAVTATAMGDTITGAIAARQNNGIDDPDIWIIEGDWPTVYDDTAGFSRLANPCATAIGLLGNLSPEQSPINKRLSSVSATQSSQAGVLISDADEAQAQTGGIDVIGKSSALNQDFFSFLTGRNASSNTAAMGIEYTRLTKFLIRSLDGGPARAIIGKLQSIRADDPTRIKAKALLDNFFQDLTNPSSGSDGYGMIDTFQVVCDLTNNPPTLQAKGFLFAYCTVRYLNVVRYFVIKLAGGGNVTVTAQSTSPNVAQFI